MTKIINTIQKKKTKALKIIPQGKEKYDRSQPKIASTLMASWFGADSPRSHDVCGWIVAGMSKKKKKKRSQFERLTISSYIVACMS